jgi:putative oxidoreductase
MMKDKVFDNKYLVLVFRLVLAGTFLVSSFGKLVDIEHYSVAMVYNFGILPGPLAIGFGWALPFLELLCALSLLFGVLTRLSALGVALLSTSFFITKFILLSRGMDVECGCFGAIGSTMASWSIYLDPALFVLSMTILFSSRRSRHWVSLRRRLPEKWSNRLDPLW